MKIKYDRIFSQAEIKAFHEVEQLNNLPENTLLEKACEPPKRNHQDFLQFSFESDFSRRSSILYNPVQRKIPIKILNLSNCNLRILPDAFVKMMWNRYVGINLAKNHLQSIKLLRSENPKPFSGMGIDLSENDIVNFSDIHLENPLTYLNLNGNPIQSLPDNEMAFEEAFALGLALPELTHFPSLKKYHGIEYLIVNDSTYEPTLIPSLRQLKIYEIQNPRNDKYPEFSAKKYIGRTVAKLNIKGGSKSAINSLLQCAKGLNILDIAITHANLTQIPEILLDMPLGSLELPFNRIHRIEEFSRPVSHIDLSYNDFQDLSSINNNTQGGSFRGNHIKKIPELNEISSLDFGENDICELPNSGDWECAKNIIFDHNPLKNIDNLDILLRWDTRETHIYELDLSYCALIEIPEILWKFYIKNFHVSQIFLEGNPWKETHANFLKNVGFIISPDDPTPILGYFPKIDLFLEYCLTTNDFIGQLQIKIQQNGSLTCLDRIHPELMRHATFLYDWCQQYQTNTSKQVQKILLNEQLLGQNKKNIIIK